MYGYCMYVTLEFFAQLLYNFMENGTYIRINSHHSLCCYRTIGHVTDNASQSVHNDSFKFVHMQE